MKKKLFFIFALFLGINAVFAQQQVNLTGKVAGSDGYGIPGANVIVKGSTQGTITDFDGIYNLKVSSNDSILVSFIGFETQVLAVNGRETIDVTLYEVTTNVDEVIVTALGLKRENKALGYSVQQQSGSDLTEARDPNIVNSLTGKVAGVNVTQSANGPGGSSRIVIRGESSLSGTNQPLFVVDGIPIRNETDNRSNSGLGDNMKIDFGNGAAEVNPEDIESITVLKGAAAAALYGSRAGNGVILITTKSGKSKKGIGVSFNSTTTVESILAAPKIPNTIWTGEKFRVWLC